MAKPSKHGLSCFTVEIPSFIIHSVHYVLYEPTLIKALGGRFCRSNQAGRPHTWFGKCLLAGYTLCTQ